MGSAVQGFLRRGNHIGFNVLFEAAVALRIQIQTLTVCCFQTEVVQIARKQGFEIIGHLDLIGSQRAHNLFALHMPVGHLRHDHFFIIVHTVKLPLIGRIGMLQIGNRTVRGHGENIITGFGCTNGF